MKPNLESMTGFGQASFRFEPAKGRPIQIVCRLKSLNHRFLETRVRLPKSDLASLDVAVRKKIAEKISRGSIDCSISIDEADLTETPRVDLKLAEQYLSAFVDLKKAILPKAKKKKLLVQDGVRLDHLLKMPGVMISETARDAIATPAFETEVLARCLSPALEELRKDRLREGRSLQEHFSTLMTEIESNAREIAALEDPEKQAARLQMSERVKVAREFFGGDGITLPPEFEERLRQEAAFWIERRDFQEERVRLANHLQEFRSLIQSPPAQVGRKLEFMLQEILREVNTLGNKAQSIAISKHVVEMKTILERVREQIANVA